MKKLISLLIVTFIVVIGHTQSAEFETSRIRSGKWNEKSKQFVYSEYIYKSLKIQSLNDVITIKDGANSAYITSNKKVYRKTETFEMYTYDAIDEAARKCSIILTLDNRDFKLAVMYEDFIIEYTIK